MDCKDLAQKIREAAMPKLAEDAADTPSKKRASSKKGKSTTAAATDEENQNAVMARADELLKSAMQSATHVVHVMMETRSYWMFAVASISIFYYGELASI